MVPINLAFLRVSPVRSTSPCLGERDRSLSFGLLASPSSAGKLALILFTSRLPSRQKTFVVTKEVTITVHLRLFLGKISLSVRFCGKLLGEKSFLLVYIPPPARGTGWLHRARSSLLLVQTNGPTVFDWCGNSGIYISLLCAKVLVLT